MIKEYIRDGKIVPSEVTVKLLENAMHEALEEHKDKVRTRVGRWEGPLPG
jgi:UMP-CMP kinase